jgi:HAD superfamily hydrolase (TIGR01509 family)
MDAVVFDFDGVIADSEPVHLRTFQQVLADAGLELSREDYYGKYLGFDDHDCFQAVLTANGMEAGETRIAEMTAAKTKMVQRAMAEAEPCEGAVALVRQVAGAGVPLAICSGALREEVLIAAEAVGVLECFAEIVAGKDVSRGKPDPEGYRMAMERLSASTGRKLDPARSVALEDSPAGVASAMTAGMKVLAVATSYPADALRQADMVVDSLGEVSLDALEALAAG